VAVACLAVACTYAAPIDPTQWVALRHATAAATVATGCGFGTRTEYCPRDADEIDPVLQRLVDKHYGGSLPTGADDRAELIAFATTDLIASMRTPAGLRRLETRINQRFQAPVISRQQGLVSVDLGAVPGTYRLGPRGPISLSDSPHLAAGEWRSTEAAATIARFAAEHAEAAIVDVVVLVADARRARWTYRFDRARQRVLVFSDLMPTGACVTEGRTDASLKDYIDGRRSLHTSHLRWLRSAQVAP